MGMRPLLLTHRPASRVVGSSALEAAPLKACYSGVGSGPSSGDALDQNQLLRLADCRWVQHHQDRRFAMAVRHRRLAVGGPARCQSRPLSGPQRAFQTPGLLQGTPENPISARRWRAGKLRNGPGRQEAGIQEGESEIIRVST